MKKFCVFCGEFPEEKNKEHVLPEWLIRMTGDPKRTATFGVDFSKPKLSYRQFSFDALTFPACTKCNDLFSRLETAAHVIVRKMLGRQSVSADDLIVLLNWLDKVRVGLWLGFLYLGKNPLGIDPTFHITTRLGRFDRMVAISQLTDSYESLSFLGPESLSYQLSPTCFWLRINHLCFLNASGMSLCSRRLGFPSAQPIRRRDDHKFEISFERGSERTMYPVERGKGLPKSVSLYQPIFKTLFEHESARSYLESKWLSRHAADFQAGYGKVFLQKDGSVRPYPESSSSDWIPSEKWRFWEVVEYVPEYVYSRLSSDFENAIAITSDKKQRKHMRQQSVSIKKMNAAMVKKAKKAAALFRDSAPAN